MGSMFSSRKPEGKVLMQGLDAAGKTTLLYKLGLEGEVTVTMPTIGFHVETTTFRGQLLTVWDVGGRDKIRPLWRHYYPGTGGLVFVVDSKDRDRIDDAREELGRLLREDELEGLPLLLVANKQDLPAALRPAELAERLGLWALARPWHVQAAVATEGEGLQQGFAWLSEAMRRPRGGPDPRPSPTVRPPVPPLDYDPAASPALERFAPIQRGTQCPFARNARLWGGADTALGATAAALAEFVRRSEADEALDGFVLELPREAGADVQAFGAAVREALTALSEADPAGDHAMRRAGPRRGWHFRFAGASFFVTSFALCYPASSPRYAFGAGSFVLLQPERSFLRHNLPHDDGHKGVRNAIRELFAKAGRMYAVPPTARYAAAPFIVRPLQEAGPTVEWWEDASTRAGSDTASEEET